MAGYSGTPLEQKLGIKPGHKVLLSGVPEAIERVLKSGAAEATFIKSTRTQGSVDVQVLCLSRAAHLDDAFERARKLMTQNGAVWISWPKKASGVATDLNENDIRTGGLAAGLVDNKVCTIDETLSGLRFVIRVKDRK